MFLKELVDANKAGDSKAGMMLSRVTNNESQVTQHSFTNIITPGAVNTIRLFDTSVSKTIGINNFSQAKPSGTQIMLVTAIQLLAVTLGAAPTPATILAANFDTIKTVTALQNGELDLYSDGRLIVRDFPTQEFVTLGDNNTPLGTVHLSTPKFVYPDAELRGEIRLGTPCDANVVIKIRLIGLCTQN